jgi:SAM-dependent methyltransferase
MLMGSPAFKILIAVCIAIGAVLVARYFVIRPLLRALLGVKGPGDAPADWRDRVEMRFQALHISVWMFAWFKLRADPMFREIPEFLKTAPKLSTALDLGCGYGVAGASALEWVPGLKLYGIDPNPKRVRAASLIFGDRGSAFQGGAPDFETPALPGHLDAVFVLDVIHFLRDSELDLTLRRIRGRLNAGGNLFVRAPVPPDGFGSLMWNLARIWRMLTGAFACYRSIDQIRQAITKAEFEISLCKMSGDNPELFWFIASASA